MISVFKLRDKKSPTFYLGVWSKIQSLPSYAFPPAKQEDFGSKTATLQPFRAKKNVACNSFANGMKTQGDLRKEKRLLRVEPKNLIQK